MAYQNLGIGAGGAFTAVGSPMPAGPPKAPGRRSNKKKPLAPGYTSLTFADVGGAGAVAIAAPVAVAAPSPAPVAAPQAEAAKMTFGDTSVTEAKAQAPHPEQCGWCGSTRWHRRPDSSDSDMWQGYICMQCAGMDAVAVPDSERLDATRQEILAWAATRGYAAFKYCRYKTVLGGGRAEWVKFLLGAVDLDIEQIVAARQPGDSEAACIAAAALAEAGVKTPVLVAA